MGFAFHVYLSTSIQVVRVFKNKRLATAISHSKIPFLTFLVRLGKIPLQKWRDVVNGLDLEAVSKPIPRCKLPENTNF